MSLLRHPNRVEDRKPAVRTATGTCVPRPDYRKGRGLPNRYAGEDPAGDAADATRTGTRQNNR